MSKGLPLGPSALPLGFPHCARCPFLVNGPVWVCVQCARSCLTPVAEQHCPICSQALDPAGRCTNLGVCQQDVRSITAIDAIAVYEGALAEAIKALKYGGATGWARIFGRLVAGFLSSSFSLDDEDLVLPNPTFPAPGRTQHTELIVDRAAREALWGASPYQTLDEPLIVKTAETPKSASGRLPDKRAAAAALLDALALPHGTKSVRGKYIFVVDDVCTTGFQLDAVARFLRSHGAADVRGLVLARAPWRQPTV